VTLSGAAELATLLIRIDRDDQAARAVKAASFRKLGYAQINGVWRSWYLSAARELEGFDFIAFARANARAALPLPTWSPPCRHARSSKA